MKRFAALVAAVVAPLSLLIAGMAGFPWDRMAI